MLSPPRFRVNRCVSTLVCGAAAALIGCKEASAPASTPTLAPEDRPALNGAASALRGASPEDNGVLAHLPQFGRPLAGRVGDLEGRHSRGRGRSTEHPLLDQIGAPQTGVRFNQELGGAILDRLAEEDPDDVEQDGVALLNLDELFGTTLEPGLCEDGEVLIDGEKDGTPFTAAVDMPTFFWFAGEPEALMGTLSTDCRDALLASCILRGWLRLPHLPLRSVRRPGRLRGLRRVPDRGAAGDLGARRR